MTPGLPSLPLQDPEWVFVALMAVVLLAPVAARRVRLPGILGLIVAGMVIGPNVLGIIERDGFVATLGGAGLLFLMFMAGLELDLKKSLGEGRRATLIFGAATFAAPMLVGYIALSAWGFDVLAAILIASCWASHTIVAYPIFQRYGVVHNRGVATAIGATVVTNVAALLVLAVVIALHVGGADLESWLVLAGGLIVLVAASFWGLKHLTRWFFAGLGGDRLVQTVYVVVMMFGASALAGTFGIEPIIGAFFAGLGMNEHVPKNGGLGERLNFLGEVLLIPVFLVSVGMLMDPANLLGGLVVAGLAITFAAQSLGGKLVAALGVGRLLRFRREEIGAMFSLTGAEAAATLAAIFVGLQAGLFGQEVVDAVVVVIMITCLVATALGERYAPRLSAPRPSDDAIGRNVLVPVANPATAGPLAWLAAHIASADTGTVRPVNVLGAGASRDEVDEHRKLLESSEEWALRAGVEARGDVRIDESGVKGIIHEVTERDVTCLLMGWKGYASAREHMFGGLIDTVLGSTRIPVLLCRVGGDRSLDRVVLHVDGRRDPDGAARLSTDVVERVAAHAQAPVVVVGPAASVSGLEERYRRAEVITDERAPVEALRAIVGPGDLIVLSTPAGRTEVGPDPQEVARAHPERTVVVCADPSAPVASRTRRRSTPIEQTGTAGRGEDAAASADDELALPGPPAR